MMILISIIILALALDLMQVEVFCCRTVGFGKNIIFGVDKGSSVHIDIQKKDIVILGPAQGLGDPTLTAEK